MAAKMPRGNAGRKIETEEEVIDECFPVSNARKLWLLLVLVGFHTVPFLLADRRIEVLERLGTHIPDVGFTNVLERLWSSLLMNYSRFSISFMISCLVHITVYSIWIIPGFLYQFFPSMDKYKFQPKRQWTWEMQVKCAKYVLFSQIGYQIPFMAMIYFFCEFIGWTYDFAAIPSWYSLVIRLVGCSCVEDTWHFFLHWLFHYPPLYKHIHKVHHEFQNPFAMTAEYAHPLEQLALGVGFALGIAIYGTHISFIWLWMAFRTLQACESHMGYNVMLYLNPFRLIPYYANEGHHDFHHENFIGNYASFYTWWDDIFDTSMEYRRRQRAKKNKGLLTGLLIDNKKAF